MSLWNVCFHLKCLLTSTPLPFTHCSSTSNHPSNMIASPRHPVMYHAIQHTIARLMDVKSIAGQNVPFVTGPGAIKCAHITTIEKGYPSRGTYEIYDYNRTITVVGSRRDARNGLYLQRNFVKGRGAADAKMGMLHYSKQKPREGQKKKTHSCLHENYQRVQSV